MAHAMSSATDDEGFGDGLGSKDHKHKKEFYRDIGLNATQARIKSLNRRIETIKANENRPASGGSGSPRRLPLVAGTAASSATPPGRAPRDAAPKAPREPLSARGEPSSAMHQAKAPREPQSARGLEGTTPRRRLSPRASGPSREELDEAKTKQQEKVQDFRIRMIEQWGSYEVSMSSRPTQEELKHPHTWHIASYRRPHQRVVVGRDEKEIKQMPSDCVSRSVKKSLSKMRENLFQRKLNLAIHEQLINKWTLPQIRADLRRRKPEGNGATQPGLSSAGFGSSSGPPAVAAGGAEAPG